MTSLLAQAPWEAVRDHLQRGGSPLAILLTVGAILALLMLLGGVHRIQHRRVTRSPINDPKKLFHSVMGDLGLTAVQRDLLRQMASDLRLEHPSVMLLSPVLFVEHARRWSALKKQPGGTSDSLSKPMEALGRTLFGRELDGPVKKEVASQLPQAKGGSPNEQEAPESTPDPSSVR